MASQSTPKPRSQQSGLTLIELMVALVVSTLLIGFLFDANTRLTRAFRSQSKINEADETVHAARSLLVRDVRQAGNRLPAAGIAVATGVDADGVLAAFSVDNDADGTGPDAFRVIYADVSRSDVVTAISSNGRRLTVTDSTQFVVGEFVVMVAESAACMGRVTSTATQVRLQPEAPFNVDPNAHCDAIKGSIAGGQQVMLFPAILRGYRLDPERTELGVLQSSDSGGLLPDDWTDLGTGFTNLQVATRFFEEGDLTDADGDGDPERDWYSSDNQEEGAAGRPANGVALQVSLTIEGRNTSPIADAASTETRAYTDLAFPENNALGDWGQECPDNPRVDPCGVDLMNTPAAQRPERYVGDYVYRSTTMSLDLRNMGVGI